MQMTGNIFLVGLMGAGKTTIGKLLAKNLGKTFHDSDHEIECRTGVHIPLIFELEGEAGFRKRESAVIADLTSQQDVVVATGGGAVLAKQNRECLSQNGTVIYLRADATELWHRTRNDKNRPLLQTEDPKARLEQLFAERDPFYCEIADIIVDTGRHSVSTILHQLESQLEQHANAHR